MCAGSRSSVSAASRTDGCVTSLGPSPSALGRGAFCLAQEPVWIQNAILPAASAKERSRYGQQEQPAEAGIASAAPGGLFLLGFRLGSCFFMDFRRIPWSPRPMVLSPFRQTCLGRVNTRARSRQQKQKDLLEKVKGLIETQIHRNAKRKQSKRAGRGIFFKKRAVHPSAAFKYGNIFPFSQ